MKKEDRLAEEFCKEYGWKKVRGYKVNHEGFQDEWDVSYWSKEDLWDFIEKVIFWSYEEEVREDVWEAVEYIEDNSEDWDFDKWKEKRGD